jgi:3-oxoacyl-[acyl-carrier protein] reductase
MHHAVNNGVSTVKLNHLHLGRRRMANNQKVAVITGAGRTGGVGAATARMLAKQGYHLALTCVKSVSEIQIVASECQAFGIETMVFAGDLTDQQQCQKLAEQVQQRWGRTDVVVNALGNTRFIPFTHLEKVTPEIFTELLATNVMAPFWVAQAFAPMLKQSENAAIINVSSNAAFSGGSSAIPYTAAKGGENALTIALAKALAPQVRVNAVCPSFIDSSWWSEKFAGKDEQYQAWLKTMSENNVLGKVLKPEDVAQAIVSLINNPAMTGELIRLDAGAHLGRLENAK